MAMEQRSHQHERAWWDSVRMLKCCRLNRGLWTSQELQHTVSLVLPSMRLLHLAEEARPHGHKHRMVPSAQHKFTGIGGGYAGRYIREGLK